MDCPINIKLESFYEDVPYILKLGYLYNKYLQL